MDDPVADLVTGPVSSWPTADLRHAYRLTTALVRRLVLDGAPADDIAACEEEAAMFGAELVRRGEL